MVRIKTKSLIAIATMLLTSSFLTVPVFAQNGSTENVINSKSNLDYLFFTFAITWIIFFGYLYYIAQKQKNLADEIKEIKKNR
jgi:CcmD family protein